jgi:tetratricopeptide (TPR) repeat protein
VQRTLAELVKRFPRDFAARNNLGVYHIGRGDFEAALEQYRAASEIAPDEPVPQANIAYTLLFLGRRDEAYDAIAKLLQARPDGSVAVTRWLSAVAAGDKRADEFYQAAAALLPPPQMLVSRSAAALWRGRLKEYDTLQAELRTQAREVSNVEAIASVIAGEAMTRAAYERGRAIDALRTTLATTKVPVVVAQGAALLASLDATDAARSLLPQFEPQSANAQVLLIPTIIVRAYLDAAAGRTKEAVASLDDALTEFPQAIDLNLHLGRLREKAGDLDGAIAAYRTVVQAQAILGINASVVPARLYLGQALAKKGDAAGARAELDALLAQWKDADGDFDLLKMARDARQKVGS